jgi:ssDNA-binding replication factor A large subunit
MITTQEIIQKIITQNPQISQEQLVERLQDEKRRTGGLLGEETLLRLIAARFGVDVQQNVIHNSGVLSSNHLVAGLNDVTVAGRLIAIFPIKTFQSAEKSGKLSTLMIADHYGIIRVILWNDKADWIERNNLKPGQIVQLLHGYTRADRYGKTELHLGGKSNIEILPESKAENYPSIEKFATKLSHLSITQGLVHIEGIVKEVFGFSSFTRSDMTDGTVIRFKLADSSGEVMVVAWNEKAEALKNLKANTKVKLVNARLKESQNCALEVHVDSNVFVDFSH